ncbi:IS3 family transposase [Alkalihalobacterium chitinilyticum]|uniref:IS3 family transposase n=1 Tax=Alkalihalobacterium chitinilyticum TaxID=2980103 RepID=A0ABT5VLP4_9BACI|nr:IS3 family transposase [Alkalihalobacterium chitinilyticum]MDE5416363.1 IS3 family transposase [Alkalihalobacterium chitinilyticum]
MPNSKYSKEFKNEVLLAYEKRECSIKEFCSKFQITHYSLKEWIKQFEKYGSEGLKQATTWKSYSKELKKSAINDFLTGEYSAYEIVSKYEISSRTVLQGWVNKYNSYRELKDTSQERTSSMTKGRKTTWEERIQIVIDCLGNGKDYQETASTYNVSYQQVYQWVKKYEDGGEEALKDKRGKKKEEAQLSPEEKINLQMKKLERENERLRAENLFFKKVRGDRKEAKINQIQFENKYVAIQELHENENLSISLLCEIADIARSAYYKWLNRTPSTREIQNEEIIKRMKTLHEKVNSTFGYRQMNLHMNRQFNKKLNHKRIYRLMKVAGLRSVIRVKKNQYKRSTPQHVTENILNREFNAAKPNEKWVTDVTEFKYGQSKKAYLSAIRDLYDGSIVSYVLGHSNNNQLVFKTLDQATVLLDGEHPLIHSDRGFQYTSKGFKRKVDSAKMTQSMSRVGRCIDNGPMESFFGTLKCEKYYLNKYKTFEELCTAIDEYIHFYNHERYQKRLNGLSPMEYRAKAA